MSDEKDFLEKIYKDLLETRMLEEKLVEIYAEGKVPGHIHSGVGQEASYVGVLATRKPGDYFKIGHRVIAATYVLGNPLDTFFGEILAKKTGNAGGRGGVNHTGRLCDGVLGMSGTLGCDAGIYVGAAMTIEAEGRDNVSYFFVGDGASNRGPVYEAMILAADWKLPVVFVCIDNGFGISTPSSYSSPRDTILAARADGFGMPSVVVDGTDPVAVYEAMTVAMDHARSGKGPYVVEAKVYRYQGHYCGDPAVYRPAEYMEKALANDGIEKLGKKLIDMGVKEEELEEIKKAAQEEMDEAVKFADESPYPDPSEVTDDMYTADNERCVAR